MELGWFILECCSTLHDEDFVERIYLSSIKGPGNMDVQ